jgi:hypothetical protein
MTQSGSDVVDGIINAGKTLVDVVTGKKTVEELADEAFGEKAEKKDEEKIHGGALTRIK